MPLYVEWRSSKALQQRLDAIARAAGGNSKATARVKGDIRKIVIEDNTEKLLGGGLLEGVDRYGRPLAPMAESTYRNPKRGFGPVLVPRGLLSRFITNFRADWIGGQLVMRYKDIVNKRGESFAQYLIRGAPKGSKPSQPNWSLPPREVDGITPRGWSEINVRTKGWGRDVVKGE